MELRKRMHQNKKITGEWLGSVIVGHQNYYAVPGNLVAVKDFRTLTIRIWIKTLRRRSQKGKRLKWEGFKKIVERLIPKVKVVHPFSGVRFNVKTQGRSRMR